MVFALIPALFLVLYGACCLFAFYLAFAGRPNPHLMPKPRDEKALSPWLAYGDIINRELEWIYAQTFEEVSITSRDGLRLRGRYLAYPGSDRAIILCHGFRSHKAETDFSCAMKIYYEKGFSLLLIDQRAHGKSQGKWITFGIREREDVCGWAHWLHETHHPSHIILDGMSMGAATVLMALDQPLPKTVKGVIADCGYTSPEEILTYVMKENFGIPAGFLMPGLKLIFRLAAGKSMNETSAPRAIAGSSLPLLLLHGEEDRFVPCHMGLENARAGKNARILTIPGAGHGVSFLVDREKCTKALDKFISGVIQ